VDYHAAIGGQDLRASPLCTPLTTHATWPRWPEADYSIYVTSLNLFRRSRWVTAWPHSPVSLTTNVHIAFDFHDCVLGDSAIPRNQCTRNFGHCRLHKAKQRIHRWSRRHEDAHAKCAGSITPTRWIRSCDAYGTCVVCVYACVCVCVLKQDNSDNVVESWADLDDFLVSLITGAGIKRSTLESESKFGSDSECGLQLIFLGVRDCRETS